MLDPSVGGAEDAPVMPPGLTLHALLRSGLVLAGLLFLAVGVGESVAGRMKVTQYQDLVQATETAPRPDVPALFPTANEGHERHQVYVAKLAFYQLLLTSGQLLSALGFALLALGVLRLRLQAARAAPEMSLPN